MLKSTLTEFKTKLLLIVCGFIVFSPLSSIITMQYLHLPLALPEILFIPFIYLLKNRLDLRVKLTKPAIFLFCLFLLLLGISFMLQNFRASSILSTSRGYLYMLLSFAVFSGKNKTSMQDITLICIGSVLGWCLLSIEQFTQLIKLVVDEDSSLAVSGNMVALVLLVSIAIIYKNNKTIILSVFLGLVLSVTTGLRRQIVVFFLSIVISYFFVLTSKKTNRKKAFFILFVFVVSLILIYPIVDNYINDISPLLHQRIFSKSVQFLSGDLSEADKIRRDFINQFINNLDHYILPQGFVSKRTIEDVGTGVYMDFPVLELAYTLGLIILPVFIFFYFRNILKNCKNYYRNHKKESAVWGTTAMVLFALLFLEGSNLNYSYITPFTGMVLGKISFGEIGKSVMTN